MARRGRARRQAHLRRAPRAPLRATSRDLDDIQPELLGRDPALLRRLQGRSSPGKFSEHRRLRGPRPRPGAEIDGRRSSPLRPERHEHRRDRRRDARSARRSTSSSSAPASSAWPPPGPLAAAPTRRSRSSCSTRSRPVAAHQSGHNSGVIHAGLYYTPGSAKAGCAARGAPSCCDWCDAPRRRPASGAARSSWPPSPTSSAASTRWPSGPRPTASRSTRLDPPGLAEHEPHAAGLAALHVPVDRRSSTSRAVCAAPGRRDRRPAAAASCSASRSTASIERRRRRAWSCAPTPAGSVRRRPRGQLRRAGRATGSPRLAGDDPGAAIMPFRGEYHELRPDAPPPGAAPHLPGARPPLPVPRRPPHPRHRRRGARRPQRGAGPRPRGLPLARRRPAATCAALAADPAVAGGWPAATGAPGRRGRPLAQPRALRRARCSASCPSVQRRGPRPGRQRRAGPGGAPRRHPARRLRLRRRRPARDRVARASTRRRPPPPRRSPSARGSPLDGRPAGDSAPRGPDRRSALGDPGD